MIEFSIIIPFQSVTTHLNETLECVSKLNGPKFEVILLPDGDISRSEIGVFAYPVKIIPTGSVSPAIKRDRGAEASRGKFLAFIDDDAYPASDWLEKAVPQFRDEDCAAVCGPQITPEDDGFWQQVSGAMFLSPLNGKAVCRYWPCKDRFYVDDWPSVNLIVRKDDFDRIGGFDSTYWPGEDTKLCLDLTEKLNKKMIYAPDVKVYHHRRAGFFKHMKQIGNYGIHRGFFAKTFPKTSFRLSYFVPSCFFIFVCFGWLMLLGPALTANMYLLLWPIYLVALCLSTVLIYTKIRSLKVSIATIPYLVCTHFWYGWRFIKGFVFVSDLKSRLGR